MNQVDFYVLSEQSHKNILLICCQLCEKALQNKMTVLIYTQSPEQAEQIEMLLWSYKANSFIAHKNISNQYDTEELSSNTLSSDDFDYPVLISNKAVNNELYNDLLINLDSTPPPFHKQFKRIAELVNNNPQAKECARHNYRFYQQADYQLNKYDL